jgi:hypothetical protein
MNFPAPKNTDTHTHTIRQQADVTVRVVCTGNIITNGGGVKSTRGLGPTITARGLGPTMTAWGQSIGISIGMLLQTLIMSRLDHLSRLGARI